MSRRGGKSAVALVMAMSLVFAAAPISAQEMASLQGTLLDPSGNPASGFKVVVQDIASGKNYVSSASSSAGEYALDVPAGPRYRIVEAITPDGTRLQVQANPPLPVRVSGSYRLPDVLFVQGAAADEKPAKSSSSSSSSSSKSASSGSSSSSSGATTSVKPWYKKPGGIIGIVAGSIAVIALATDDDDDDNNASPSAP
ncbi:hypothetical protein ABI59_02565 [Acidobacteria bacterium Mor1]|nr:hypothetical protein ABI59_02565 [Acidobacteria bacterium Mor1]